MLSYRRMWLTVLLLLAGAETVGAQPDRVIGRIDTTRTVLLRGHVPPHAQPQRDQAAVGPSFALPALTLHFRRSAAQQRGLEDLLVEQQNPRSSEFHRWLTPEQFAQRFGVSPDDLRAVETWLHSQGFAVLGAGRSRERLTFSGTAGQVRNTFHVEIHQYFAGGKRHYGNANEPAIPSALQDLIAGIDGLYEIPEDASPPKFTPQFTSAGRHNIAPDDLATIYDIAPLYQAGVDGTGQKLVVIGNSRLDVEDIRAFRRRFNLPDADPQMVLVPNLPDPGVNPNGMVEADLDVEWAGAVARNATILYVYSTSTLNALGYAIDQNLAPVISMSFSRGCEAQFPLVIRIYQTLAQQANAQGITWINSAGDAGAAGCDANGSKTAQNGRGVRFPASIPEVTAVGGTQFDEQSGTYWKPVNDGNGASAISYIPEAAWNSSATQNGLWAGGGGPSLYFAKPEWQTAPGVPKDDARDVPDVSIAASFDHDGYYAVSGGASGFYGGTSIAAPVFAGVAVLLNHYLVATGIQPQPGLGNINPALYRLAQNASGVFHDITAGNNAVPCAAASPQCEGTSFGSSAASGYDLATGLGSPDVSNLVQQWSTQPAMDSAVYVTIDPSPVYQQTPDLQGFEWHYTIMLHEDAGVGTTLTDFTIDGSSLTSQIVPFFGSAAIPPGGTLTAPLGAKNLAVPRTRVFVFSGMDASGRQWTRQLSILFTGPAPKPAIAGIANAASGQPAYAPGMILSLYGTRLGAAVQAAAVTPPNTYLQSFYASINGVPTPLYYVSANQVNVQIPYETRPGTATLQVNNSAGAATLTFEVTASAPGIFMDSAGAAVPFAKGSRGQVLTLFITGEGQVTPSLATGSTPAPATPLSRLPVPRLPVKMTIGGVDAPIEFVGIPSGLVGVTQVNFQVPQTAPLGLQDVVVSVGDAASPPAKLTVQ